MQVELGFDELLIPAVNLVQLLDNLQRHCGIAPQQVLPGTGINPQLLSAARGRVTPRQHLALLRNARARGMPDDFGLDMASNFDIGNYGLLGYAMMSAATLHQAIDIALRYYKTAGPLLALEFVADKQRAELIARDQFAYAELLPFAVDSLFANLPQLLSWLTGQTLAPRRVALAFAAPPHRRRYLDLFQIEPVFDSPDNRFGIDPAVLQLPLVRADAGHARLFEHSCRELLQAMEGNQGLTSRVRRLLLESPGQLPSAADAAAHFGIGERTLRRRLRARGTSYQHLVDDVRRRMAIDYLQATDLPIQQVAELLGYTEATNFRRAFVKWTGTSPVRCRCAAVQIAAPRV